MAHLAFVIDEAPTRRDAFLAKARILLGELPGVTVAEERHGPFACIWAAGTRAPVDVHRDANGCSIFIGYGIAADGRRVAARDLHADWLDPGRRPCLHDGYHVGVVWSAPLGLAAGAIDALDGAWRSAHAGVGGGTDSWLEYLRKASIVLDDEALADAADAAAAAVARHLDFGGVHLEVAAALGRAAPKAPAVLSALQAFYPATEVSGSALPAASRQRGGLVFEPASGVQALF